MSAIPYYNTVDFDADPRRALERLREQVFSDGQYEGAEKGYKSIEELMNNLPPSGSRSILDVVRISDVPEYSSACSLGKREVLRYFDVEKPEMDVVENLYSYEDFWNDIGRGQAVYTTIFDDKGKPLRYLFAGYSYD